MSSTELILYLEPSAPFKDKVKKFLDQCKETLGVSTANKYGCHVTMAGFFHVDNEQQQSAMYHILDAWCAQLKACSSSSLPTLGLKSVLVCGEQQEPAHLLLPVHVPDKYHTFMATLADQCLPIVPLRLKKINHISLAYWDEPKATAEEQQRWNHAVHHNRFFEKVQESADTYFDTTLPPASWDIVFYKRVFKGELVGQEHIFKELGRWSLS